VPTEIDRQVSQLRELFNAKLTSVQKQFDERDVRGTCSEDAVKLAVVAALQAQKAAAVQNNGNAAAIAKSEVATIEQIDGNVAPLGSNTSSTSDKISAMSAGLFNALN